MSNELREVRLNPASIESGQPVKAELRYRLRDSDANLSIEASAGFKVAPQEVYLSHTRTEKRIPLVLERTDQESGAFQEGSGGEDLCILTFSLESGAMLDANIWVRQ